MTEVIAPEVAEEEFNKFCENADIDNDTDKMDDKDREGFGRLKDLIVRAIVRGSLVFNDDYEPVYTTKHGSTELTFREPSGATYMAMDRQKDGNNVGKLVSFIDAITKSAPGTAAKLKGVDFKVARTIAQLFMD